MARMPVWVSVVISARVKSNAAPRPCALLITFQMSI